MTTYLSHSYLVFRQPCFCAIKMSKTFCIYKSFRIKIKILLPLAVIFKFNNYQQINSCCELFVSIDIGNIAPLFYG